jgi:hypothetical protein
MSEEMDWSVLRAQVEQFLREREDGDGSVTIVCDPVTRKRIRAIGIEDDGVCYVSNLAPPNTIYLMSDEAIERLKEQEKAWLSRLA